jgi:hypothetical protein
MKKRLITLIVIVGLFCSLLNLLAQEPPKEVVSDETKKPVAGVLEVKIDSVEGEVEVLRAKETSWMKAEKGMLLQEGSKISTGFKSKAILLFADNSTVLVKSLTQMNISRFAQKDNEVETKLKVRIGTVRVQVNDKKNIKTDLQVSTPNATASVKGTKIKELETTPLFGDTYLVETGHVNVQDETGRARSLKAGESTDNKLTHPIEYALLEQSMNITPLGSTEDEKNASLTSVSTPVASDVQIGDNNSEVSNPAFGDRIVAGGEVRGGDVIGGIPEEHHYPPWYELIEGNMWCPYCMCGSGPNGCGCDLCQHGLPFWFCTDSSCRGT